MALLRVLLLLGPMWRRLPRLGRAVPVVPQAARRIPGSLVKLPLGHGLCRVHGSPLARPGPGSGAGGLCRSIPW